jgi:hypothetical protein
MALNVSAPAASVPKKSWSGKKPGIDNFGVDGAVRATGVAQSVTADRPLLDDNGGRVLGEKGDENIDVAEKPLAWTW